MPILPGVDMVCLYSSQFSAEEACDLFLVFSTKIKSALSTLILNCKLIKELSYTNIISFILSFIKSPSSEVAKIQMKNNN